MTSDKKSSNQSKDILNKMKYEVANDLNIVLKDGYNGNLTSKQAGSVGGEIIKRLVNQSKDTAPKK